MLFRSLEGGRLVLTPIHLHRAEAVRERLEQLGVTEADVAEALDWAADEPMALIRLCTDRQADAALRQRCRRTMASFTNGSDGAQLLP